MLRHNNIVPLWGIATGFGRMPELRCLVSPWMPNGTLTAYLTSNHNDLTVLDRSRMLEDVSAGLRYLHSESVMHGDITGANILIDRRGHARLIDFGLSTIVQPLSHLAISSIRPGAIRYAAPELVLQDNAGALPVPLEKADIYSFGCIMLQVLSGRLPWSEIRGDTLIIVTMSQGRGPPRPNGHPAIIDLDWNFIQNVCNSDPNFDLQQKKYLNLSCIGFLPQGPPDRMTAPPDRMTTLPMTEKTAPLVPPCTVVLVAQMQRNSPQTVHQVVNRSLRSQSLESSDLTLVHHIASIPERS
ncbi:kinase-like domain-containing protein [Suillus lakei]|nr:kinase-like domain-containing protein [Suillus lakei]